MPDWSCIDLSDYDSNDTDETKILTKRKWVPCRICWEIFARVRPTARYCASCHRGFCEGEHGSFTGGRTGVCVRCYNKAGMINLLN
jgi:hypothetical protein